MTGNTPDFSTDEEMVMACLEIADRAGDEILRGREQDGHDKHTLKHDGSPVTAADHAANDIIVPALCALRPDIPVISEEEREKPEGFSTFWLTDPLDATREYIKGGDEFTVNIALVRNGVPVFGVITAPAKGQLAYIGGVNIEPRKRDESGNWHIIRALSVIEGQVKIAGSKNHHTDASRHWIKANHPDAEVIGLGSSLKFCAIAEGRAHFYPRFGRTMEWDTAAGQAILSAAGGSVVTVADGKPLEYGKPSYKNPDFIAGCGFTG